MERTRLLYLIRRYSENTASPAELQELSDFIGKSPDDALFTEVMMEQMERFPLREGEMGAFEGLADKVLAVERHAVPEVVFMEPKRRHLRKWAWAAACILLMVIAGIYVGSRKSPGAPMAVKRDAVPALIVPGKSGALLTLADGSTVALDSLGNGKIASQNGADVFIRQGKLAYAAAAGKSPEVVAYNTLSTPRGRQYHIQLPDGTEVWLNAASSIRYPTVFGGGERVVDITGEAYFEVVKDASRPFRVQLGQGARIDVLGTHFNVNAYGNEPSITTTLLEGRVRFNSQLLKPGQQTRFDQATRELTVANDVETARVVAWKNGIFDFNNMGLREAMQQLERWYDIDVKYEKKVPNISFFGKMTKNIQLADLLTILERSKVHFQVEGRTLIVRQ
ncbi:MAG TPA: FecR domain-containing protein [Puia sp.]|nr:FecR domain-containing protein [Puia sp.]